MRQNSIIQFYFAIIMALFLVGCEKDNLKTMSEKGDQLSLETAKSYFEQSYISGTATKSGADIDLKSMLFYSGDFTPQWNKAIYSKNAVFEGYDVNIHLPKYKYVVEREYYENGAIKTFEVPVSQRLVVRKEEATGMLSHYILSLIPDKYYNERTKKNNIVSLSQWEDFSGIAVYSNPQTGGVISVARFINGRKFSNAYVLASTKEEVIENVAKAIKLFGTMKIKSKVRLMTKSVGCGGDGDYGSGPEWQLGQFYHLFGPYYSDGQDIWEDIDRDGMPDCICLDAVIVSGGGGQSSGGSTGSSTDPFEGIGGGTGTGTGSAGGGGGNGSGSHNNVGEVLTDEEAYELGYAAVSKINDDIFAGEYNSYQVRKSNAEIICEPISHIANIEGLWASWLPIVEPATFTNFGKALGVFGAGVSFLSNLSTIAVLVEGDEEWSNLSTGEQLELISTSLSTIGAIVGLLPLPVAGQVAGATISTVGCVVGLISTMFTVNLNTPYVFELLLDNGTKAYIYIG